MEKWICETCNTKDNCGYKRKGDCIDVQTFDSGFEQAILEACDWLRENAKVFGEAEAECWDATYKYDTELLLKNFKQAMYKKIEL